MKWNCETIKMNTIEAEAALIAVPGAMANIQLAHSNMGSTLSLWYPTGCASPALAVAQAWFPSSMVDMKPFQKKKSLFLLNLFLLFVIE